MSSPMPGGDYNNVRKTTHPSYYKCKLPFFRMETFEIHLKGRQFKLFADHMPLEKLGQVPIKT
jgi:hypothetical protein